MNHENTHKKGGDLNIFRKMNHKNTHFMWSRNLFYTWTSD